MSSEQSNTAAAAGRWNVGNLPDQAAVPCPDAEDPFENVSVSFRRHAEEMLGGELSGAISRDGLGYLATGR